MAHCGSSSSSKRLGLLSCLWVMRATALANNAYGVFLDQHRQLPGAGLAPDERWQQVINADRVNPDTLAREGTSATDVELGKMQSQATAATEQAETIAVHLKTLKAEAESAATNLKKAKEIEETLWDEAQEKQVKRREEDSKLAASTAGWSARLDVLSNDISDAKDRASEERKDREAIESKALAAERLMYEQKAVSAAANTKLEAEVGRIEGETAQKLLDKQELADMKKMLQKAKVQAAGLVHERDVAAMAEEAGKKMGAIAKTYKAGTPMAEAVGKALADAVVAGKVLEKQVKEAEAAGIKVDLVT